MIAADSRPRGGSTDGESRTQNGQHGSCVRLRRCVVPCWIQYGRRKRRMVVRAHDALWPLLPRCPVFLHGVGLLPFAPFRRNGVVVPGIPQASGLAGRPLSRLGTCVLSLRPDWFCRDACGRRQGFLGNPAIPGGETPPCSGHTIGCDAHACSPMVCQSACVHRPYFPGPCVDFAEKVCASGGSRIIRPLCDVRSAQERACITAGRTFSVLWIFSHGDRLFLSWRSRAQDAFP